MRLSPRRSAGLSAVGIVSCIAVVFLHACNAFWDFTPSHRYDANLLVQILFRFGVPCFLMVTGATLMTFTESYGIKDYVRKRFLRIGVPFLIWSELFIVWGLARHTRPFKDARTFLTPLVTNQANGIYWYFYAIFGMYAFIPLVSLAMEGRSHRFRNILVGLLAIQFYTMDRLLPFLRAHGVPITWDFVPPFGTGYFVFCCLGWLLAHNEIPKPWRLTIYAVGLVTAVGFFLFTRHENLQAARNVNSFFQYDSLPGILCAVPVFLLLTNMPWERWLGELGRTRMRAVSALMYGIYLVHIAVLTHLDEGLVAVGVDPVLATLLPVRALVTWAISLGLVWLLRRIPVVGRWLIP